MSFSCGCKKKKKKKGEEARKYKEMEEGKKEKRKNLFGLRPHKSGPWALQRIAQDPIDYFLISPSELSGTHLSSPPLFISCRHWQGL